MRRVAPVFCLAWLAGLTACATHRDPGVLSHEDQAILEDARSEQARRIAAARQCGEGLRAAPAYALIRDKVELVRAPGGAVPADIAGSDGYPTASERDAIAAWALARQRCQHLTRETQTVLPFTGHDVALYWSQVWDIDRGAAASVDALVVSLYEGKLTYGEFARKRDEIGRDSRQIKVQLYNDALQADEARDERAREEALAAARTAYEARMTLWTAYIQAVNARPIVVQQQAVVVR